MEEDKLRKEIVKKFGGHVRLRVCGICVKDGGILMIRHKGLGKYGQLWLPPGGGMEFGSDASQNLIREFKEETGLEVKVKQYLFTYEFIDKDLHSVEMFFEVAQTGGQLGLGTDPELHPKSQIMDDLKYIYDEDITQLGPDYYHEMIGKCANLNEFLSLKGYFSNRKKQ